jgi:hypothetical protein
MSATDEHLEQGELEALGRQYMDNNPDMYDTADLEALGAAVYVEKASHDDTKRFADIAEYISNNEGFHDQRFKFYKQAMGGNQYDEEIVGEVSDLVEGVNDANEAGPYSVLWESLYKSKSEDLDEANEIIRGILEELDELDLANERDVAFELGNVNLGNQVLSEQPPGNLNFGNQVVIKDHQNWSSGGSQPNSDDLYEEWRNDENWETDF